MTRVLLVEASSLLRAALARLLASHAGIEVIGETARGPEAVELTKRLRPQVVLLDGNLARDASVDATKQIMVEQPTPVVVMLGAHAEQRGIADRALQAGAVCVVPKPTAPALAGSPEARRLLDAVRAMADVRVVRHARPAAVAGTATANGERGPGLVAIAASTGGPAALEVLLSALAADFPLPIAIVQHISRGFAAGFVTWLDGRTDLTVKVAEDGGWLAPGCAYVAPDDRHLGVTPRGTIELSLAPPIGGFRPSASFLFASVARGFDERALAVILTGMGNDGLQGLADVRAAGGRVLAQDEESSVIFGMPGAAVAAGIADEVLPLDALAARIETFARARARTLPGLRAKGGRS